MTTTQKLAKIAAGLGWNVATNSTNREVRDNEGNLRASAVVIDGRFYGGFTVDSMGHVMSHNTARDLFRFMGAA